MKVHYFEDLKGFVASFETPQDIVIYTLKEHNATTCQLFELKDKLHRRNMQPKDNLRKLSQDIHTQSLEEETEQLKARISRRNMQIKELKNKVNDDLRNAKCVNCGSIQISFKERNV